MRLRWLVIGLLGVALVAGCGSTSTRDDLVTAEQRWEGTGIDDYRMAVEVVCFCDVVGVVDVEVMDGTVVALEPRDPEVDLEGNRWADLTVEAIFDDISHTIATGEVLEATYDPDLGHPILADLDPEPSSEDDERTYRVTELHPTG